MGTNYYVRTPGCPDACPHCSESTLIHLGKSSAGWRFLHRADPTWPRHKARELWERRANLGPIEDEYGKPVTLEQLKAWIRDKQDGRTHTKLSRPRGIDRALWDSVRADDYTVDGYDFCAREFS